MPWAPSVTRQAGGRQTVPVEPLLHRRCLSEQWTTERQSCLGLLSLAPNQKPGCSRDVSSAEGPLVMMSLRRPATRWNCARPLPVCVAVHGCKMGLTGSLLPQTRSIWLRASRDGLGVGLRTGGGLHTGGKAVKNKDLWGMVLGEIER